jgi:hypothetical protein
MLRSLKSITILVCAVIATSTLADQHAQSAMNQNGSAKVIAQLRQSWKNIGPTRNAAPLRAANSTNARSLLSKAKQSGTNVCVPDTIALTSLEQTGGERAHQ